MRKKGKEGRRMEKLLQALKNNWKPLAAVLALAVLAEVFVFNFRHWESLGFAPATLPTPVAAEGFIDEGGGVYRRQSQGNAPMALEYTGIGAELKNIQLGITHLANAQDDVKVNLEITDEANKYYYHMPTLTVMSEVPESRYFRLYLKGESEKLRLLFSSVNHGDAILADIKVNVQVPFFFSPWRLCIVLAVLAALWWLRPGSPLYTVTIGKNQPLGKAKLAIIALFVLCNICVFGQVVMTKNPAPGTGRFNQQNYYSQMAQSLLQGRVDMPLPVAPQLLEAENPYDSNLRGEENIPYSWDMAYFEGKYYLYFGVSPVLVFTIPYFLLTGRALPNYLIMLALVCLLAAGVFLLLYQLIKKLFDKVPLLIYLLLGSFILYGSNLANLALDASIHNISVLGAVAFAVCAFAFWLCGLGPGKLHPLPLFVGSCFMALVAGLRPPMLFLAVFALPLFWGRVFKTRQLFSRRGIAATVCLLAPLAVFGAFFMWYNAARFGSVFNFGHKYMLTTHDMSTRVFIPSHVGRAIFYFFFQPPAFSAGFPFLQPAVYSEGMQHYNFVEPMFGGIFASQPLLWVLPLWFFCKAELKAKKVWGLVAGLCGAAVALAVVTAINAGLAQRYTGDFYFIPCVAAALLLLALIDRKTSLRQQHMLRAAVLCGTLFCLFYAACLVFSVPGAPYTGMREAAPNLFYRVLRQVQFWM